MLAMLRSQRTLVAFTAAYIAGFGIYAARAGEGRYLLYAPVLILLITIVALVNSRIRLTAGVLWGLSLWGLAHMAGGLLPSPVRAGEILYNLQLIPGLLRYDQAVHAFGFGVATAACWQGLRAGTRPPGGSLGGIGVVAWLMGMGLGAVNEVFEFLSTLVLHASQVGGYENTGWDLVFNLFGSGSVVAWLRWWPRPALREPGSPVGMRLGAPGRDRRA
jgi:hypothetical protein